MIVSHKHRFIFLKTRKTAGTSIEVALSRLCDPVDIITPIAPEDEAVRSELGYLGPRNLAVPFRRYRWRDWRKLLRRRRRATFYNHMPAVDVRAFVGDEVWSSYYKFCFERNPWDRMVSAYFWRKYDSGNDALLFEDFLREQHPALLSNYHIYSIDSRVVVDFVGRFENVVGDLRCALDRIGIGDPVELPQLKAKARTDRRPYREIITPQQRAFIAAHCGSEITLMDYRFE